MSDDLASALAGIRSFGYKAIPQGNATFDQAIRAARDVPRLLAAVEAALAHHVPAVIEDMPDPRFRYCDTCSGHPAWPCPEVAAITAELAKGAGDA